MDKEKENLLYDLINFSVVGICLINIIYCIFVKLEDYNMYFFLTSIILVFSLLYGSSKITPTEESRFNIFAEIITIDNIKYLIGNIFYYISTFLTFLLIIYPFTELILWILSTFFPKWWPNTYSVNWITDFATKYLPYSFHPNCTPFAFFMTNFLLLILFYKVGEIAFEDDNIHFGGIVGLILLYSFYDEQFFDMITHIAWMIGCIGIAIILLMGMAGNSGENSNNGTSENISGYTEKSKQKRAIAYCEEYGNSVHVCRDDGSSFNLCGKLVSYSSLSVSVDMGGDWIGVFGVEGHRINAYPKRKR